MSLEIDDENYCPVMTTLLLIGGKWKPLIIYLLTKQILRFSAIKRKIPQVTQKMLTQQLRELEKDGLVNREVYPVVPPKVEYSLTNYALTLIPIMEEMAAWGRNHIVRQSNNQVVEEES